MTLPPFLRKAALTAHVTASAGWMGAVAVFLALAVAGLMSGDAATVRGAYVAMDVAATVRGAYVAMDVAATWVIVPLAVASLVTGLVQSFGTPWGLFRHYWVVVKLIVTVFAGGVLLLQLDAISYVADEAAARSLADGDLRDARLSLVVHAGLGLLVLALPMVLSVYKPRGLTRHGHRVTARAVPPGC